MKQPIAAYHFDKDKRDLIFIKAYIIDQCNYDCLYCYNKRPRTDRSLDLNKLERFLDFAYNVTHRNIFLELIGGEPTLHKNLIDFCNVIHKKSYIHCIYIYSNFSVNIETYIELLQMKNIHLDLTWHSIKNDRMHKEFYSKAKQLLDIMSFYQDIKNNIAFNIMLEHNNIKYVMIIYKMLKNITPFVDLSMVGDLNKIKWIS